MMSWPEGMLRIDGETTQVPRGVVGSRCPARVRVWRPIAHVAKDLGITPEVLRKRVRQAEADNDRDLLLDPAAQGVDAQRLRRPRRARRPNKRIRRALPPDRAAV